MQLEESSKGTNTSQASPPIQDWSLKTPEQIQHRLKELLIQLGIKDCNQLKEEINITNESIELEDEGSAKEKQQAKLRKLEEAAKLSQLLEGGSFEDRAERPKRELERILKSQLIKADQVESRLAALTKRIQLMQSTMKPAEEVEPFRTKQRELLKAKQLMAEIKKLESGPDQESQKQAISHSKDQLSELRSPLSPKPILTMLDEAGNKLKPINYNLEMTLEDILKTLSIKVSYPVEIHLKEYGNDKSYSLRTGQQMKELTKSEGELEGALVRLFTVQSAGIERLFPKGSVLDRIRKEFWLNKKTTAFFEKDGTEIDTDKVEELDRDIEVYECLKCTVLVGKSIFQDKTLPLKLRLNQLSKYLRLDPDRKNLFPSALKINENWETNLNQEATLQSLSKQGIVREARFSYSIELNIVVINQSKVVNMKISSTQPLLKLKEKLQDSCKIRSSSQLWIINRAELRNNNSNFEEMGYEHQNYRVQLLEEVLKLEHYAFSKEDPISIKVFQQLYVEDDEQFKEYINKGDFPSEAFEYPAFRQLSLGIIFAAVKKHSRIKSAISSIRQLVMASSKPVNLWRAKTSEEKSVLNEHYILHNIVHSAEDNLKIEFMRTYKNHSPLPLVSWNSENKRRAFYEHHFWVCNKSFTVVSLEIGGGVNGKEIQSPGDRDPAKSVFGKSTFLNRIFGTEFENGEDRHPKCNKSAYIQYSIYRNERLPVDLIDVSSSCLSDEEKADLCKGSNMVILHYKKKDEVYTREWSKLHCVNIPVILVERDNDEMEDGVSFKKAMAENSNKSWLEYRISFTSKKKLDHFEDNFNEISDQIHSLIRRTIEQDKDHHSMWKFTKYLAAKGSANLGSFVEQLEQVEANFANIIDNTNQKSELESPNQSQTLQCLLRTIDSSNMSHMMAKLREFIRVTSNIRLRIFQEKIPYMEKLLEKRTDSNIKEISSQIIGFCSEMGNIEASQTTLGFRQALTKFKQAEEKRSGVYQLSASLKQMREEFAMVIKPREFSIENLWRQLAKTVKIGKRIDEKAIEVIQKLYYSEFVGGKTFEVINGETLKMPIKLLRSNLDRIGDKKVMVVAVLGQQSSGKSTLLNFLFGCDFLSSDGRCTSGVYGTYYELNNMNIGNCEGVLLLDTEGLFSNFEYKCELRKHFDNKLVLFLLKVCDIVILNSRSDIDVKCQNILELAFECDLMEYKPGTKYPNLFIVLNQTKEKMNSTEEQEVIKVRDKILRVAPKMNNFVGLNQSTSLPLAFNTIGQEHMSKVLKELQQKNLTPTDAFYTCTKKFALELIKTLRTRGESEGRTLEGAYEDMYRTWNTITTNPLLTKYSTRHLKKKEEEITSWKVEQAEETQRLAEEYKKNIEEEFRGFDQSVELFVKALKIRQETILMEYQKKFPKTEDVELNKLIEEMERSIEPTHRSFVQAFQIELSAKRTALEIQTSKCRGINEVIKTARDLRNTRLREEQVLDREQQQTEFDKIWQKYVNTVKKNLNRSAMAQETYRRISQVYSNVLRSQGLAPVDFRGSKLPLEQELSNTEYNRKAADTINELVKTDDTYLYQDISLPPIICLSKNENTDSSFKYLDMTKIFQLVPCEVGCYFQNSGQIYELINEQEINRELVKRISEHESIKRFVVGVDHGMQRFGAKLVKRDLHMEIAALLIKKAEGKQEEARIAFKDECDEKCELSLKNYRSSYLDPVCLSCLRKEIIKEITTIKSKFESKFFLQNTMQKSIKFIEKYEVGDIKQLISQLSEGFQNEIKKSLEVFNLKADVFFQKQLIRVSAGEKPMLVNRTSELREKVKSLSIFIRKEAFESRLGVGHKCGILIGSMQSQTVRVHPNYEHMDILKAYVGKEYDEFVKKVKSREFKQFIREFVQHDPIIQFIIDTVNGLKSVDINENVRICVATLNEEIGKFNKDLRQISQQLTFRFVSDLHDLCLHILWKWHEQKQWEVTGRPLNELKDEHQKQLVLFTQLLSTNIEQLSNDQAKQFFEIYRQFIVSDIPRKKQQYLDEQKILFCSTNTRDKLQQDVDSMMLKSDSAQEAFECLVFPERVLEYHYNKEVRKVLPYLQFSSNVPSCYEEMIRQLSRISSQVKRSKAAWHSDEIFSYLGKDVMPTEIVKDFFVRLFSTGKSINSETEEQQAHRYKLKPDVDFELEASLQEDENINFFESNLLKDLQIGNYAYFVSALLKLMRKEQESIYREVNINEEDRQRFIDRTSLRLCKEKCKCCGKLCDVDTTKEPVHKHRCRYGHQMQAVAGTTVEKAQGAAVFYYPSMKQCNNLAPASTFTMNGRQTTWNEYTQSVSKVWDFTSEFAQEKLFIRLWDLGGRKVCEHLFEQKGKRMDFINHKTAAKALVETQYVFALDGSGWMKGERWNQLIVSVKNILSHLGISPNNKASIVVFNDTAKIIFENRDPSMINVNCLNMPGGVTTPAAPFKAANEIFQRYLGRMCLYFIYVSDGDGDHPAAQIKNMLSIRSRAEQYGHKLYFSCYLIQGPQSSKQAMEKIRKELNGTMGAVESALQIESKFKEVLDSI